MNFVFARFCQHFVLTLTVLWASLALQGSLEAASLKLQWTDQSNDEEGFKIERLAGANFTQIAIVGANTTTYTDPGLVSGATYCYRVRAFNSAGSSDPSNGACGSAIDSDSDSDSGSSSGGSGTGTIDLGNGSPPTPSYSFSHFGTKWGDYLLTVNMRSPGGGAMGVLFRYQDHNNYYRFVWNKDRKSRRLEKRQNGEIVVLAEERANYGIGRTYKLDVQLEGDRLYIYIDGQRIFSVTDPTFSQGSIALFSSGGGGTIFDDVNVFDLPAGNTLLTDNFDDGNFVGWTILDDQTANGEDSNWSAATGSLVQSSATGSTKGNVTGTYALYTRGNWTNYRAITKLKSLDNDCIGMMFRYQDNNNYYRFSWCIENGARRLEKFVNGAVAVLSEDNVPYTTGQQYHLQVVTQDSQLHVLIDGVTVFSVTDSAHPGGTVALYSYYNQGSLFDDVLVEDLATSGLLLWDDFKDGDLTGWMIFDEGSDGGPSAWSVNNGALLQNSNLGSQTNQKFGTYALY